MVDRWPFVQLFRGSALWAVTCFMVSCLGGCTPRVTPDSDVAARQALQRGLTPEQRDELLGQMGENWLYGNGVGETALAVGTVLIFPPYAAYLLGNAALSLSGYEPLSVSRMLPEEQGKQWSEAYDTITAGPGHAVASLRGREFITREEADQRIHQTLKIEEASPEPTESREDTHG